MRRLIIILPIFIACKNKDIEVTQGPCTFTTKTGEHLITCDLPPTQVIELVTHCKVRTNGPWKDLLCPDKEPLTFSEDSFKECNTKIEHGSLILSCIGFDYNLPVR